MVGWVGFLCCWVSFGFLRWGALICFKVHLARGSGSNVGPLFKVLHARVSDPYNWSLFSKNTTRILMLQA